jgi:hypothetical protein
MPITYKHTEYVVLNETQEDAFISFVTGIWPGAAANIQGATLKKVPLEEGGSAVYFAVRGIMVAATPGELPTPPFRLDEADGDYRYEHVEEVQLTGGQITAFANFLSVTWSGAVGDVARVSFTRVEEDAGVPGIDIQAQIVGTKEAATIGDLPPPPLDIVAIT